MNSHLKLGIGLLVNFALLANPVLAQLPPISFESPEYVPWTPVQSNDPVGWDPVAGSAVVSGPGEGFGGGQGLKLPAGADEAWLRREISWDANEKTAFIDFQMRPAAQPEGSLASFVTNGSQLAFQVPNGSGAGQLWAFNGSDGAAGGSQWFLTPGTFTVPAGAAAAAGWMRVTLRHDYERNLWDLFIDGKLAAVNLAFEGRGPDLTALEFFGGRNGDTLIDDLSVQTGNMLFADADKDGLPDSWESAHGSNPNLYDRDQINPATGRSFLDGYLDTLWVAGTPVANGLTGTGNVGTIPPLTITAQHQPVGALKGAFSVAGDGTASYSVPIDLPKGAGGMEPKISLGYSSGGGNGMVGLGWGINGFQRITRGPSSVGRDGSFDPVDFDASDRFFLDGERLVCVAGTYGAPGSEYRTEIDSFARITAVGAGPASWKVETKAGLIVYLGGTADSKVQVAQGPLSWGVNRVEDTVGNYYEVEYARDAAAGQPFDVVNDRISAVHYTGNAVAGLAPYCHVYFDYEERPDSSRAYTTHAGYRVTKRLSKIRVTTEGFTNHSYRFNYLTSYQTGRSLLNSVTKLMQDNPALAVPATTFNYDGLKEGEALWKDPGNLKLPGYTSSPNANGNANSAVSTAEDGKLIRLNGNSARAHPLPAGTMVYPDTVIQFEFKSDKQSLGAVIGLDSDMSYQASWYTVARGDASPLFRVGGAGNIPMGSNVTYGGPSTIPSGFTLSQVLGWLSSKGSTLTPYFVGPTQAYSVGQGWKTFSLNAGQWGSYAANYLVLMCADENMSDGLDEAQFRNLKIYRSGTQQPANVAPFQFEVGLQLPRITTAQGTDNGVVPVDINGDGLVDFADWTATGSTPQSAGHIHLNMGSVFEMNDTMLPPTFLPLGINPTSTTAREVHKRHDIIARPMDIDGDGRLDLLGLVNAVSTANTLKNEYAFHTWNGSAWQNLAGWELPFRLENSTSSENYNGRRRTHHFQWVDLNQDGFQDLAIQTTPSGYLYDRLTNALIAGPDTGLVYLNQGRTGTGWLRDDSYRLPGPLVDGSAVNVKDMGRRLMDLDGDGLHDIAEAYQSGTTHVKRTYRQLADGSYRWNVTPGLNPPASPYDFPVSLVDAGGVDEHGVVIIDCNGDGLPDLVQSVRGAGFGGPVVNTWLNHGNRINAPWQRETTPGTAPAAEHSYEFPLPLSYPFSWTDASMPRIPYGYEVTDLNGDGLPDVLYSNEPNSATAGPDNLAVLNTGDGWRQREAWGTPAGVLICANDSIRERGERYARLQDVNSDGFPDLISRFDREPSVWFNQCRPEVLLSATDGFGSELRAEYKRLNDPSPVVANGERVYVKGTGALPAGQSHVIDSRLVVSRYSERDGMGGRRYKSQRYGDLRYDRIHEASLGFGWVEAIDELNGQRSRTETVREYPFAGSPAKVETFVQVGVADLGGGALYPGTTAGLKRVTLETAAYDQLPPQLGIGGVIRRPVQTFSEKSTFDLDGDSQADPAIPPTLKIRTTTTQALADFDAYGFVTHSEVQHLDGSKVVSNNSYTHVVTASQWHLGRLSQSAVTKLGPGKPIKLRNSTFAYSTSSGLLSSEITEPGNSLGFAKAYQRDAFGNVKTTQFIASGQIRHSTTDYDAKGRFAIKETNQLGHEVSYQYDLEKALLLSTTNVGGKTTWFHYDSFGTLIRTDHPGGTQTAEITGYASNASIPAGVAAELAGHEIYYFRAKESSGTAPAKVYLDATGRELVAETLILKDANASGAARYSKVYGVTRYDERGRKIAVSQPFAAGETPLYTHITYDFLDRALVTIHPDGGLEQAYTYAPATPLIPGLPQQPLTYSRILNRSGQALERWENQHGQLVQSKDPSGQLTVFRYDHDGRLVQVNLNGVPILTNTYDIFGNKTAVWEANSGTSSTEYNGFGEVVKTTTANNQVTTYAYDSLGRQTTVARPEGTYYSYYDHARGDGIGQPWKTTGPLGYHEEFAYDALGRPASSRKTQFGETFTTSTTYDALGRTLTSTDAGGLVVLNGYDPLYSFPVSMTLAGGLPGSNVAGAGTLLWHAGTFDSTGKALTQTLAQGVEVSAQYNPGTSLANQVTAQHGGTFVQNKTYSWDGSGNLTYRTDAIAKRTEAFGYDHLNRLVGATVAATPGAATNTVPPAEGYTYDAKGNLLTKGASTLTYGGTSPHAVTSATIKGVNRSYTYDAAGYVLNDSKRTYTWTSFGQLATLSYQNAPGLWTVGGEELLSPGGTVFTSFEFDAEGNRARQSKECSHNGGASRVIEQTLYLGSYEREQHEVRTTAGGLVNSRTVHRHSLGSVVYVRSESPYGSSVKLTTILKDHLGTTDLLLTGTWNGTGFSTPTKEYQAFDPWGERRNAADWTQGRTADTHPYLTSAQDYDRGYTGHEQLDDSGLIHMNGRIYDPELGRMLSPDPFVQIPEYSQNFNRYSYVLNNPLNTTDPSGFSWLSKAFHKLGNWIKENWRTIVVIVIVAIVTWGVGTAFMSAGGAFTATTAAGTTTLSAAGMAATGAIAGAVGGGLNAALNGGDLGDVLRGALVGAAQGAISGGILHGLADGIGYDNIFLHIAGHGVVGGTANEAMGGKFSDGFLSAAAGAAGGYFKFGEGNIYSRTIKAGIIGGTASVVGGGKFGNGAWTASFQHLLNAEITRREDYADGSVGANDDGGPDPRMENAFDTGLLGKSEFMIVTWTEEFQPIRGDGTNSNALAMRGYLTVVNDSGEASHYNIVSGGNATRPTLVGANSRIPSGVWRPVPFREPLPPYNNSDRSMAFWREGVSFKISIPTPGTGRGAILFHPTPGYTSGCIGFCGGLSELTDFRDKMIGRSSYPKLFIP